jgi:hypothetical protein
MVAKAREALPADVPVLHQDLLDSARRARST